jgi:hypothetical protein
MSVTISGDTGLAGAATGALNGSLGATTPSTVVATDLTTTGNTILGNASTDTLNVGNGGLIKDASGNVGIGGTLSLAGGAKFSTNVFEIGKTYIYGDFTGVQGVASNVAFLALVMGNDSSGAGKSALYLVNPRVAGGNTSTSATKIAGDATMSATFAYAATNIFRVTYTGYDSSTGWKCVG